MTKKLTKKAAKKDLTGIQLASINRKIARLAFRVKVLERSRK